MGTRWIYSSKLEHLYDYQRSGAILTFSFFFDCQIVLSNQRVRHQVLLDFLKQEMHK